MDRLKTLYPSLYFIKCKSFIHNKKYIIIYRSYSNIFSGSIYIGVYLFSSCIENKFRMKLYCYFVKEQYTYVRNQPINEVWIQNNELDIYELHSKKNEIQNAMEQRSLNLIFQNIIGDNMFIWE